MKKAKQSRNCRMHLFLIKNHPVESYLRWSSRREEDKKFSMSACTPFFNSLIMCELWSSHVNSPALVPVRLYWPTSQNCVDTMTSRWSTPGRSQRSPLGSLFWTSRPRTSASGSWESLPRLRFFTKDSKHIVRERLSIEDRSLRDGLSRVPKFRTREN